jgi:hypothetical protein
MKYLFQINFVMNQKAIFYFSDLFQSNHNFNNCHHQHRSFLLFLKEFLEIRSQIKVFILPSQYDFFNILLDFCASCCLENGWSHVLKLKTIYLPPIANHSKIKIFINYYACQTLSLFFFNFKAWYFEMKNIYKNNKNLAKLK